MRKRLSLKCCLFGIGIPLTFWLTLNLVSWDMKLSADWNQPQRLSLRARKTLLVRSKVKAQAEEEGAPRQCEEIPEVINKALVKHYNTSVLHSFGIVSGPEDQIARDEGKAKRHKKIECNHSQLQPHWVFSPVWNLGLGPFQSGENRDKTKIGKFVFIDYYEI